MPRVLVTAAAVLFLLTGCSQQIRNLTTTYWTSEGLYVGYWEGTCKPLLGCDLGNGHVQWCSLGADNSLSCQRQDEVSALLDRKAK